MRQTVVYDGIQEKLGDIMGNNSYDYSMQKSMMENNKRINKSILGESANGKVMAGMNITTSNSIVNTDNGNEISVSEGYGITKSGKIIKFGKSYSTTYDPGTPGTYRVYIKYIEAELDTKVNTITGQKNIIVDQVGANGEDKQADGVTNVPQLVFVRAELPSAAEDEIFVGTVEVTSSSIQIFQATENSEIDYSYVGSISGKLGTTNADLTNFFTSSFIPLPPGKLKIKKMNFLRKKRSTNSIDSIRQNSATNYQFEISVNAINSSGNSIDIANGAILGDTVQDNDIYSLEFNAESATIEDMIGIEINMNNTYASATIGDYETAFTGSDVYLTYEIDKFL